MPVAYIVQNWETKNIANANCKKYTKNKINDIKFEKKNTMQLAWDSEYLVQTLRKTWWVEDQQTTTTMRS